MPRCVDQEKSIQLFLVILIHVLHDCPEQPALGKASGLFYVNHPVTNKKYCSLGGISSKTTTDTEKHFHEKLLYFVNGFRCISALKPVLLESCEYLIR